MPPLGGGGGLPQHQGAAKVCLIFTTFTSTTQDAEAGVGAERRARGHDRCRFRCPTSLQIAGYHAAAVPSVCKLVSRTVFTGSDWSSEEKQHFYEIADSLNDEGFTRWGQIPSYRNDNIYLVERKYTFEEAIVLIRENDQKLLELFTTIKW